MISKAQGTGRISAIACGVGLAVLVAIQFVRPPISNPPVIADLATAPEIKQILRTSCYDCHSNETRLAWFDEVVPAYWLVAKDVNDARRRLNFSEIGKLPLAQQKATLYEAVNQIQLRAMPPPAYTRLHHAAVVTSAQLNALKSYLDRSGAASAALSDFPADQAENDKWIRESSSVRTVALAPNGIEFPADYRNWKAISTTDRFDNQTMRVILGNDIAIRAIAAHQINPWPNGTTFAKVAWVARVDGQGQIRPGPFVQVEFMIRNSQAYASTKGWGWARWRGVNLTPYGRDAGFSSECIGCHAPVRDNDYVFTMPLRGQQ